MFPYLTFTDKYTQIWLPDCGKAMLQGIMGHSINVEKMDWKIVEMY